MKSFTQMDDLIENSPKVLGNQHEFLSFLHGLGAATDVELEEEVCGVGLDGVHRHKKFVGDLLVGESLRHEFEDFVFAFADAEFFESRRVEPEIGDRDGDDLFAGEAKAGPHADGGEEQGEESHVEFDGEVADEIAVLELLEQEDEGGERESVYDDGAAHGD